jgi:hypothetical protein
VEAQVDIEQSMEGAFHCDIAKYLQENHDVLQASRL